MTYFTFWQPAYQFNSSDHNVMVYILIGPRHKRHYIGCTIDIHHRLRQHNGEISGGAKYTAKHRPWQPLYLVTGFIDRRSALRFETKLQHSKVRKGKYNNNTEWAYHAIRATIASGDGKLSWPTLTIYG